MARDEGKTQKEGVVIGIRRRWRSSEEEEEEAWDYDENERKEGWFEAHKKKDVYLKKINKNETIAFPFELA